MFECVEDSLELLGLFEVDLPLSVSISISIGTVVEGILELFGMFVVKENNVFTKSLLGTTWWYERKKQCPMGIFPFPSHILHNSLFLLWTK